MFDENFPYPADHPYIKKLMAMSIPELFAYATRLTDEFNDLAMANLDSDELEEKANIAWERFDFVLGQTYSEDDDYDSRVMATIAAVVATEPDNLEQIIAAYWGVDEDEAHDYFVAWVNDNQPDYGPDDIGLVAPTDGQP